MSFLQKYDVKNKLITIRVFIADNFLTRFSASLVGASLIFSLILIQITPAEFYVSATLREAQVNKNQGIQTPSGGMSTLLALGGKESNNFNEFNSNLHSYILAQRMWSKGWGLSIFDGGELGEDFVNKLPKKHTIPEILSSFFLGYELYDYYSPHDLQAFIQATVYAKKAINGTNITVSMMARDKDFAIRFLNEIILETDQYAKEYLIAKSNALITGTFAQLADAKNASIAASLSATINSEYFKIASLDNDLPHQIYFIDPPHSSEYPVTPKVSAIVLSNIIIFLFASILYSFLLKNKEDLW
mgnify:CR=1 FL=1